jgi:hypothetical protein
LGTVVYVETTDPFQNRTGRSRAVEMAHVAAVLVPIVLLFAVAIATVFVRGY